MSELSQSVICISIIGPDKSPLFITKSASFADTLEVEAMIFETLTHLESIPVKPSVRSSDRFLPRIHKNDKMIAWAYRASLHYIVLLYTPSNLFYIEKEVLKLLEKVKDAMFYSFTNPFYHPFAQINSPDFEQKVFKLSQSLVGQQPSQISQ